MRKYVAAYNNDEEVKKLILERVASLEKQGLRAQSLYFQEGIPTSYTIGIPVQIAYAAEEIFKNLKGPYARKWARRFFSRINVGADLRALWPSYAAWLLSYSENQQVVNIRRVFQKAAMGGRVTFFELRGLADKALEKPISRPAGYAAYACVDPAGPKKSVLGDGLPPCPSGVAECVDILGSKPGNYTFIKQAEMMINIISKYKAPEEEES